MSVPCLFLKLQTNRNSQRQKVIKHQSYPNCCERAYFRFNFILIWKFKWNEAVNLPSNTIVRNQTYIFIWVPEKHKIWRQQIKPVKWSYETRYVDVNIWVNAVLPGIHKCCSSADSVHQLPTMLLCMSFSQYVLFALICVISTVRLDFRVKKEEKLYRKEKKIFLLDFSFGDGYTMKNEENIL